MNVYLGPVALYYKMMFLFQMYAKIWIACKKKYKVSFRKLLVHCKFRQNVSPCSSNKCAQAGANPPKTKLGVGAGFLPVL